MLVPDSQRNRANAILTVSNSASGLLALLTGGALYALIGVAGVIFMETNLSNYEPLMAEATVGGWKKTR